MSKKRKTTTIQVSPELNLILTNYATKKGISKVEAADQLFGILYPGGLKTDGVSLKPENKTEEEIAADPTQTQTVATPPSPPHHL